MRNVTQTAKRLKMLAFASASTLAIASHAAAATATVGTAVTATPTVSANVIKPLYGNIGAFYGNIGAFYGNIGAFYGNIGAFYGNIGAFYGPLGAFYGNIGAFTGGPNPFTATTDASQKAFYGSTVDPFWGGDKANPYTNNQSKFVNYAAIKGFWTTESSSWMAVQNAWAAAKTTNDFQNIANQIQNTVLNPAGNFWGAAVKDATKAQDFATGYSNAALTAAGIKLNGNVIDPNSLAALTPTQQAAFFLNFYDGLMSYSGAGHVDWWMGATGWSPALAAQQGTLLSGAQPVTVGMLDFTVTGNAKNANGSLLQYGANVFSNGHGAAVGSLIMGSIDGSGIMGVLPTGSAQVIVYDPYDSTNSTNWTDVGIGIQTLANSTFKKNGAPTGVLNASLGVPGWTLNPGWNTALASGAAQGHNLVIAAGNDGSTQTANVPWNFALNPNLLIVGSVGVDGTISNFSNRPGEACLLDTASSSSACVEANKLKYRFITAPGELVLVSDGNGGITRQTGTSLAAPLVSGTIALLQTRWPWLASHPDETAQIILKSATPKGTNPGADAIYGVGELNIAASQSPLSYSKLTYYTVINGKQSATATPLTSVVSQVKTGSQSGFDLSKLSFTAIETIGSTYRDFQIPLASSLVGQKVTTGAGQQLFQSYLATGLKSWAAGGGKFAEAGSTRTMLGFTSSGATVGKVGDMDLQLDMAPRQLAFGYKPSMPYDTQMAVVGKNQTLRFGYGGGAAGLNGQVGFSERSDYEADRGGANPLLGLASGGAFADYRVALTGRLALSAGVTQRHDNRDLAKFGVANLDSAVGVYAASATHFGLDYAVTGGLVLHTGLTRLHENSGLLGVQSLNPNDLGRGSDTTGTTFGFDLNLPANLTFSASGTLARTTLPGGQAFSTPGGLNSSAGEVALTRSSLFAGGDRLRLTVAKSLQVDSGKLNYASYGVVDRQTGELGIVNQTVDPSNGRVPASVEMLYGRLLPKQGAEVSLFARAGSSDRVEAAASGQVNYVAGAKYRISF